MQCSAIKCITLQLNAAQCNLVKRSATQCIAIECSSYSAIKSTDVEFSGPWCSTGALIRFLHSCNVTCHIGIPIQCNAFQLDAIVTCQYDQGLHDSNSYPPSLVVKSPKIGYKL